MDNLYEVIFEMVYGIKLSELTEKEAEKIKMDIIKLRKSYRSDFCDTSYDENDLRNAYMISYFPNYIYPAYEVVKSVVLPEIKKTMDINKKVHLNYFAAGPCPELLGTVKALRESNLGSNLKITILEYEKGWKEQREVMSNLLQKYPGNKKIKIDHIYGCDVTLRCKDCREAFNLCLNKMYKNGDIFFMENCLNHINDSQDFISNLKERISYLKKGAMFIIIDLNYDVVREVLKSLQDELKDIAEVVRSNVYQGKSLSRYTGSVPEQLKRLVFIGKQDLIAKVNTYYYYMVLCRK